MAWITVLLCDWGAELKSQRPATQTHLLRLAVQHEGGALTINGKDEDCGPERCFSYLHISLQ